LQQKSAMIRRLFVFLVFCSFQTTMLTSTPDILTDLDAVALPGIIRQSSDLPHGIISRSRSNSKKNLHISIGTVEVRRLDLESRRILSKSEETETDCKTGF
jgi:hypothetical protein